MELQKLGSSVSVGSSTDEITFTVQSLKKNLPQTLALLEERMFNPIFKEETFKLRKRQNLEGLKQAKTQPAFIASNVIAKSNYGENHILGMDPGGTEQTINNITLAGY